MIDQRDYWKEAVLTAAEECGLAITPEQIEYLAECVQGANATGRDVNELRSRSTRIQHR